MSKPKRARTARGRKAEAETFAKRTGRSNRWGATGYAYVLTTVFLALGGVNGQNNLLFIAFGFAIAGLVMSGAISGGSLMSLQVRRSVSGDATAREVISLRYSAWNRSRFIPAFALRISEGRARRNRRAERKDRREPLQAASAPVEHISPRGSATVAGELKPAARGWLALDAIEVSTTFPFGLMQKTVSFSQPQKILVWPARVPLKPDIVNAVARRAHSGGDSAPAPGRGEDFFGLREYREGDSISDIAWRATARSQSILVRQRSAPRAQRVWIGVTLNGDTHDELVIAVAAELARACVNAGRAVGIWAPHPGVYVPPSDGRAGIRAVLDALALIDSSGETASRRLDSLRIGRDDALIEICAGQSDESAFASAGVRLDVRSLDRWCSDPAAFDSAWPRESEA